MNIEMKVDSSENIVKVNADASNNIVKVKAIKKTFKEYYQDPEFKARHLASLRKLVVCEECKTNVKKYNLAHHRSSQKHKRNVLVMKEESRSKSISVNEVKALIEKLQKLL